MRLLTIKISFHKDSSSVQKLIKFERSFHKTKLHNPKHRFTKLKCNLIIIIIILAVVQKKISEICF